MRICGYLKRWAFYGPYEYTYILCVSKKKRINNISSRMLYSTSEFQNNMIKCFENMNGLNISYSIKKSVKYGYVNKKMFEHYNNLIKKFYYNFSFEDIILILQSYALSKERNFEVYSLLSNKLLHIFKNMNEEQYDQHVYDNIYKYILASQQLNYSDYEIITIFLKIIKNNLHIYGLKKISIILHSLSKLKIHDEHLLHISSIYILNNFQHMKCNYVSHIISAYSKHVNLKFLQLYIKLLQYIFENIKYMDSLSIYNTLVQIKPIIQMIDTNYMSIYKTEANNDTLENLSNQPYSSTLEHNVLKQNVYDKNNICNENEQCDKHIEEVLQSGTDYIINSTCDNNNNNINSHNINRYNNTYDYSNLKNIHIYQSKHTHTNSYPLNDTYEKDTKYDTPNNINISYNNSEYFSNDSYCHLDDTLKINNNNYEQNNLHLKKEKKIVQNIIPLLFSKVNNCLAFLSFKQLVKLTCAYKEFNYFNYIYIYKRLLPYLANKIQKNKITFEECVLLLECFTILPYVDNNIDEIINIILTNLETIITFNYNYICRILQSFQHLTIYNDNILSKIDCVIFKNKKNFERYCNLKDLHLFLHFYEKNPDEWQEMIKYLKHLIQQKSNHLLKSEENNIQQDKQQPQSNNNTTSHTNIYNKDKKLIIYKYNKLQKCFNEKEKNIYEAHTKVDDDKKREMDGTPVHVENSNDVRKKVSDYIYFNAMNEQKEKKNI
ncbi:conserved Plasmodium protein, unknown function [Plasmodium gaboni]|uniref:Heptatricopeptide repeat-containing protein n=1 Tax=Plasmodium gaboni TaxID=647221 RepID=A0ABY1UMZ6_9APIC|nr:conserved Plasmodium protein, unknown function [Plasmodium gaboni]